VADARQVSAAHQAALTSLTSQTSRLAGEKPALTGIALTKIALTKIADRSPVFAGDQTPPDPARAAARSPRPHFSLFCVAQTSLLCLNRA
jgi:hypothetical protein